MRKFMKKALAVTITATMVLASASTAFAAETASYEGNRYELITSGDYKYVKLNDTEAALLHYIGENQNVVIPATIDGLNVVALGKNDNYRQTGVFQDNAAVQTVTISKGIKQIDDNAFTNCEALQQVLIPNTVETINYGAFFSGGALQRVQFEKDSALKFIGQQAFAECSVLDDFTIPEEVETIGNAAFASCAGLTEITIPDSVTDLGEECFAYCSSLETAVIGSGVTELKSGTMYDRGGTDEWANGTFENCPALTQVTIGENVKTIGLDAFANANLEELTIPDSVETIGQGAFCGNRNMEKVVLGKGVKTLGDYAFLDASNMIEISLNDNIRSIGKKAFSGCSSLLEMIIPSSCTFLGEGAFLDCTSLVKADIGNGITELRSTGEENGRTGSDQWSDGCFERCISLKEVILGDGLKTIGMDTFVQTAIEEIELPDSLVTIGKGAFWECRQLESIEIPDSVTSIGDCAFVHNDVLSKIKIGYGVTSIGTFAFGECPSLKVLNIPSNVTSLGAALCIGDTALERVIIGNGVTMLDNNGDDWGRTGSDQWSDGCFERCSNLTDVTLGAGLTTITTDTFALTGIKSLVIPSKVATIGNGAFYGTGIKNLYLTGAAPTVGSKLFGETTVTPAAISCLSGKSGYDKFTEDTGYAVSTFEPIKVSYDLNNDDVFAIAPSDQIFGPEGGYVIEPLKPMAADYIFRGWYADKECQTKWVFEDVKVTESTTIYAKWEKIGEVTPEAPKAPGFVDATKDSLTIEWDAVEGATGYIVYVNGEQVETAFLDTCKAQISDLQADTAYEISVVAVNEHGQGEISLVSVLYTTEDPGYELGDPDYSGTIDANDALAILKVVAKMEVTSYDASLADVDYSKNVDANDALIILKYVAKMITEFVKP